MSSFKMFLEAKRKGDLWAKDINFSQQQMALSMLTLHQLHGNPHIMCVRAQNTWVRLEEYSVAVLIPSLHVRGDGGTPSGSWKSQKTFHKGKDCLRRLGSLWDNISLVLALISSPQVNITQSFLDSVYSWPQELEKLSWLLRLIWSYIWSHIFRSFMGKVGSSLQLRSLALRTWFQTDTARRVKLTSDERTNHMHTGEYPCVLRDLSPQFANLLT